MRPLKVGHDWAISLSLFTFMHWRRKWQPTENPRDGGAWWAAVYGVTQSRTRMKWLSSSSSNGLVVLWDVGSSPTRDKTRVSCIGRWILHCWATKEALFFFFFNWSIVDLQCCRCIANWLIYKYVYIYIRLFSIIGYYKIVNIVPCAIELVLIYLVHICVCDNLLSCVWLCIPMDCSLPGSSAHAISQARIL